MAASSDNLRKSKSSSPDTGRAALEQRTGILSRTLTSSSSIRWILPARIRSPLKNDVVFVGHTFIQLHEFQDSGQLLDTTAKLDFGTTITDAKVISADLETVPVLDAILGQERDLEQFRIRGHRVGDGQPPQLLVLITRENDLIYVYARETSCGDVHFVFAKRPLLRGVDLSMGGCRDIAVDPKSRALAVAAPSGFFGVFKLRAVDEITAQIDGWDPRNHASFQPAEEQRFIQIDGKILLMCFLPSPAGDPSKVVLLLLVYHDDQEVGTYQYLYKWDIRESLRTIKPMNCSGRMLKEDHIPTMLIPSTRAYAYMVITLTGITYYESVQASQMQRVNCRFAGDPSNMLEWVQWSRPRRHTQYLQRCDDIVILREDGLLRNFFIDKNSSTKFSTNNTIGHLGFSVDTAFAMLSGPPGRGGDILLVGGSMTDGGVFHVSARGSPERIQTLETLAPLNDITTGLLDTLRADRTTSGCLYACSGPHDDRGVVSEIRYGLEAQIGWKVEFPDAAMVDQLFSLELPAIKQLLLLASHTTSSSMLAFELETQEISFTDPESHPHFDFDHPTLAATVINNDTVVQVTTTGVQALWLGDNDTVTRTGHLRSNIDKASFVKEGRVLALARRGETGPELCLLVIEADTHGNVQFTLQQHVQLNQMPSSICCTQTQHGQLIMTGNTKGELDFAVAFSREGDPYEPPARGHTSVPLLPGEKDPADQSPRKVQRVGLQLVTPQLRYPSLGQDEITTFSTLVTGDNSDILHEFIDWKPTDDVNHYEWLVLALEQPCIVPPGPGHGRVVCVNAKSLGKGKPDSSAKVVYSNKEPITAICAYKKSSLLIACGKEIVLRHLDFSSRRWETLARHPLPSMATRISCQGSLICVATKAHSLFVLVERDNQLRQHKCDVGVRYAKDIAVLDTSTAVFASADADGTDIIGYGGLNKEGPEVTPLFHAKMPGHIHQFRIDTSTDHQRSEQTRFYGASIDGTIFHFSLLKHNEWKLLHFVEEMSYLDRKVIKAVPMRRKDADNNEYLWKPPTFRPKDMHVRGDRLMMMIEDGPYNLRNILKGSDLLDNFNALVWEVIGETDQPVEVAIAWIRRLLR